MEDRRTIKSIEQTCWACPSQWNIYLNDGSYVYVRYRHGWFSFEITSDGVREFEYGEETYPNGIADGFMEEHQMKELLREHSDIDC